MSLAMVGMTKTRGSSTSKASMNDQVPKVPLESESRKRQKVSYEAVIRGKVDTCKQMVDYRSLQK
ncbi:unnamed protein product, partial [Ilex paraguariensis]